MNGVVEGTWFPTGRTGCEELRRWLERIPVALRALAALALLTGWTLDLAAIEAFDAWNGKTAGPIGAFPP